MSPMTSPDVSTLHGRYVLQLYAALVITTAMLMACTSKHPRSCDSDKDCEKKAASGEIEQDEVLCHVLDRWCVAPCEEDKDCAKPEYQGGQVCEPRLKQCVPGSLVGDGGGLKDGALREADVGVKADAGPPPKLGLGQACGSDATVCASGQCVDGVCCASACTGVCEQCSASGQCEAIAVGQDPGKECATVAAECTGSCSGQRGCTYPVGTVCSKVCEASGAGAVQVWTCGTGGACERAAGQDVGCGFSRCTGTGLASTCAGSCGGHGDCMEGSACDRQQAEAQGGQGRCVDPGQVAVHVGGTEALSAAVIAGVSSTAPYVVVAPGSHPVDVQISGKVVWVIGAGTRPGEVELVPTGTNGLKVGQNAELYLQGVAVRGPFSTKKEGVSCQGLAGTPSKLRLVEMAVGAEVGEKTGAVSGNYGIGVVSNECNVAVSRATISNNEGGGLLLAGKSVVVNIVNTVIFNNGNLWYHYQTGVTGVSLGAGVQLTFINNTVSGNVGMDMDSNAVAGVGCGSPMLLVNSIIENNSGEFYSSFCTLSNSVDTGLSNACDLDPVTYRPAVGSACIDSGNSAAASALMLDHDNHARVQGAAVDKGAFEVK